MSKDIEGIERVVLGFNKMSDKDGGQHLIVEYKLKPLKLSFLQKIFNINPRDPDPVVRDMICCFDINEKHAKALQKYVINAEIDLNMYDFQLDCNAI